MKHHSYSSTQTKRLAADFAVRLAKSKPSSRAKVVLLRGELGAGKTTFSQGFFRALGVRSSITSPTFVLVKRYRIKARFYAQGYHLDCYRVHKAKEIQSLGFKELLADPRNIVLIEWPERIPKLLPRRALRVQLQHGKTEKERIILMPSVR